MRTLLFIALALLVAPVAAAQQACICTSGCTIASDPYPPGTGQPTSCTVTIGANTYGGTASTVVASSTIPTSNATSCLPSSPAYNPGASGSVACSVAIPAQANNSTVTLTMTAANAAGPSGGTTFTFQSVQALPTVPSAPSNIRKQ